MSYLSENLETFMYIHLPQLARWYKTNLYRWKQIPKHATSAIYTIFLYYISIVISTK